MRIEWKTFDGEQRIAHAWKKKGSKAAVACIHGMGGSGEEFHPLPSKIDKCSFYALDLRGQGCDPVKLRRGVVLDLESQINDISAFMKAIRWEHPEEPLYLMGESMGALLSAAYMAKADHPGLRMVPDGLILSVPVVGLARPVNPFLRRLLRLLGALAPRARFSVGRFVNKKSKAPEITRDQAYHDALRKKPHHIKDFSLGFLLELADLIDASESFAARWEVPTLVLAAGCDCFVNATQISTWFEKISAPDKKLHIYPEAYHLLWHDWDKEAVLSDIHAWLTERI
jgi:alpha-beta hydrolase superfamily lysophospholipase